MSRQKWRLIASPSPVPPYLLLVDASAWENASNSRPSCSSVIPMPVSETANVMPSSPAGAASDDPPPGESAGLPTFGPMGPLDPHVPPTMGPLDPHGPTVRGTRTGSVGVGLAPSAGAPLPQAG